MEEDHWARMSVLGKRIILFGMVYWLFPQQLPMSYEQNPATSTWSLDILDTLKNLFFCRGLEAVWDNSKILYFERDINNF